MSDETDKPDLHSNLFILILVPLKQHIHKQKHLHSNLFILIPYEVPNNTLFTLIYILIYLY